MYSIHNDTVIAICLITLGLILIWEIYDYIYGTTQNIQCRNDIPDTPPRKIKSSESKKQQKVPRSKPSKNIVIPGSSGDIIITSALINAMTKMFPEESRVTLVRFLIARKASVKDASDMLRKYKTWHAANMPPRAAVTEGALASKCIFAHGKALDGSPILYFRGALYDNRAASPTAYVLAAAHIIEKTVTPLDESCSHPSGESVTVLIHTAYTPGAINAPADVNFIRDFVQVLSANYPERLRRLVVYPFPWYGRAVWVVVKPFLDPRTAEKVVLLTPGKLNDGMIYNTVCYGMV